MSSEGPYVPAMIDDTIDLRPYFLALFRLWPIVAGVTLLALIVAAVFTLGGPPMYEARVGVAIVSYKTEFSLEPSLETVTDAGSQRAALVELAKNVTIAQQVAENLGDRLPADYLDVGALVDMVSASAQAGDLIEITVRANDPDVAYQVADAWATAYERHINEVYVGVAPHTIDALTAQTDVARSEYEVAEQALVSFAAENPIPQLERTVAGKMTVIEALQTGSVRAVADLVNSELNGRIDSMVATVSALQANHGLAFSAEQDAKRAIVAAYTDAYTQTQASLVGSQVAAQTASLEEYLSRRIALQRLRQSAESLLAASEESGAAGVESNALALALLKAEVFASAALPEGLALQVGAPEVSASAADQVADLRALVQVLDAELTATDEAIDRATVSLSSSAGLIAPEPTALEDDPLYQALREQYRSLFSLGELVADADALAQESDLAERRDALAQLVGSLEYDAAIPAYFEATQPLEQAIAGLDTEVRSLNSQLEEARGRERELNRARDLAWETYTALSRKVAEQRIESELSQNIVRVASAPRRPVSPSGRPLFQVLALALAAGLTLGAMAVFFVTYLFPDWRPAVLWKGSGGSADHLATEQQ